MRERARYDAAAEFYVDVFSDESDSVTSALLELLGALDGKRVLDLACGHGRVTRELARRGAHVVGVDISPVLLDTAHEIERADPLGITYLQEDASRAYALTGELFDIVSCNYGLSDIDDLDGALATVSRVLDGRGVFVFSIVHPCFPGWGTEFLSSWQPGGGGYFDEGWWIIPDRPGYLRSIVGANHRTLSTYMNALTKHGLSVEALDEPREAAWAKRAPGAEEVPIYLVVRCRKTRVS